MKKFLIYLLILTSFQSYSKVKDNLEKRKICKSHLEKYPKAYEIFKTGLAPNIFDGGWTWTPCVYDYGEKCTIRGFRFDGDKLHNIDDIKFIVEGINFFNINGKIELIGYSDNFMKTEKESQEISLKRAKNVEKALRDNGLKKEIEIVKVVGMGSKNPIDTNETVEGKYNNRRVELFLKENEICDISDYFDF